MCLKLADVPVMVSVNVPVLARLPTLSLNVLELDVGFGLKEADTLLGTPEAEKLTLPPKPLAGVTVMVELPAVPRAMLRLAGEAARLKFGPAITVSETEVELTKFPQLPVIVKVNVPVVAVEATAIVSVLAPVVRVGLRDAVTPLGAAVTERLTAPLKPFRGFTLMVLWPEPPWATDRLPGEAPSVKLPTGFTMRVVFT